MRMNRGFTPNSSIPVFRTFMQQERVERLADRPRLFGIEWGLDTTLNTAEGMHGIRILHANHVFGKLVVFDELHARSVSQRYQEVPE